MDVEQLRAAKPDALWEAARKLQRLHDQLAELDPEVKAKVSEPLGRDWQGEASSAAQQHIGGIVKDAMSYVESLDRVEAELTRFADGLAQAKDLLSKAELAASRHGFRLKSDGSFDFPDSWFELNDAQRDALQHAGQEVSGLLQRAVDVATQADTVCAEAVMRNPRYQDLQVQTTGRGGDDGGDDSLLSQFGDMINFEDSPAGEWWSDFNQGDDRSLADRIFMDPDGRTDIFGDMNAADEYWVSEAMGASPDELFGEDVVDRVHEEGLSALPDAMWDSTWEGVTSIDDRASEGLGNLADGVESFVDDPGDAISSLWE